MDCRTCAYSDWDYPSVECAACRGYSNHTTTLPLPGMCPGEDTPPKIEPLYMNMLDALETIATLNQILIQGEGEDSVRAGNMLAMIRKELNNLKMGD